MTPAELQKYIRYLRGRIDALLAAPTVRPEDVSPFIAEIHTLRRRVAGAPGIEPSIREHIMALNISIPQSRIPGTSEHFKATWWMNLPLLRNFYLATRYADDREIINRILSDFRNLLHDIYCLVDATYGNPEKNKNGA
jgi:hypothetical protein